MSSKALDILTIERCLFELEQELGIEHFASHNQAQADVLKWYFYHHHLLNMFSGLKAKGSRFYKEINTWLQGEGFDIQVDPFDPDSGFVVASILHKIVKWLKGSAKKTDVYCYKNRTEYEAFELPREGIEVYEIDAIGTLVKLITAGDSDLWLLLSNDYDDERIGINMVKLAFDAMQARGEKVDAESATIPCVDFDLKPDISFLVGLTGGVYTVDQALQQFKFHMDADGAEVKVATSMIVKCSRGPLKVTFNRPFYGWWTQRGLENIPFAAFYADVDSWQKKVGGEQEYDSGVILA
jgi:hypothetical protein